MAPPLQSRIVEALIEVNTARRNLLMYPEGHRLVAESIQSAFQALQALFDTLPTIDITVSSKGLRWGDHLLESPRAGLGELARALKDLGAGSITLHRTMRAEDLKRFLALSARPPAEGLSETLAAVPGVDMEQVDYSHVPFHEKKEIDRRAAPPEPEASAEFWERYVDTLLSSSKAPPQQRSAQKAKLLGEPQLLAAYLMTHPRASETALRAFQRAVPAHFSALVRPGAAPSGTGRFARFLENLPPSLRRRFFSATLRACTLAPSADAMAGFLGELSPELLLELRQAMEGVEVSRSVARLVQKMAGIHDGGLRRRRLEPHAVEALLKPEAEDRYVIPEYGELLDTFSTWHPSEENASRLLFEDHRHALQEDYLQGHLGRAFLLLLDPQGDPQAFCESAEALGQTLPDLVDIGMFDLLVKIHQGVRLPELGAAAQSVRESALRLHRRFLEPVFLEMLLDVYETPEGRENETLFRLLQDLGPEIVPETLERLLDKRDPDDGGHLVNLLAGFRERTVAACLPRLHGTNAEILGKLIPLLSRFADGAVAPYLKPFLRHGSEGVRTQALACLLRFGDPEAVALLRRLLRERNSDTFRAAAVLAGGCRVSEVSEDLLAVMKPYALSRSGLRRSALAARALGRIGSLEALPVFEKIACRTWTLYPSELAAFKQTVYESLEGYPTACIRPLLDIGSRSKDPQIRRACERLRKRAAAALGDEDAIHRRKP